MTFSIEIEDVESVPSFFPPSRIVVISGDRDIQRLVPIGLDEYSGSHASINVTSAHSATISSQHMQEVRPRNWLPHIDPKGDLSHSRFLMGPCSPLRRKQ